MTTVFNLLHHDPTYNLRSGRGNGDARDLRFGIEERMVHPGIRLRMRNGFGLRLLAGGLAVWTDRGHLGRSCRPALVAQAEGCASDKS